MSLSVVCAGLGFAWPDGTPVLTGLDAAFGSGRTGLIGRNGSGKTTLLRLIAGRLSPTSGTVSVDGDVGYLDQGLTLDTNRGVAGLLGIDRVRSALHAIEAGEATEANFAAVGDDWDVEERALAQLERFGVTMVGEDPLDRPVGTLSGGEAVLTVLAGLALRRCAVTLLDEPTNNLDLDSQRQLAEALSDYRGALLMASHDHAFLRQIGVTRWWEVARGGAPVEASEPD